MTPQHLVFLDLETTGATPLHDRIIEIGLCEVVDGEPVEEWSTLVNPGKTFSPFIEQLTGIANEMVTEAPTFAEIAGELRQRLTGKVLVAHNARFDYGFLKSEFRRLGIAFQERSLCTVKLSRALFPQHRRHNLDALVERHGLSAQNRHRALGDARLVREFFQKVQGEVPADLIARAVQNQLQQPSLPPHLPVDQIDNLPNAPGVYLLFGENDTVLYVGKSVDIRSRVRAHFASDHRLRKEMRLSQQVRRVDYIETAGELGALLLEARLVKDLAPIHNRQLRRSRDLFSLRLTAGRQAHPGLAVVSLSDVDSKEWQNLFGMFRSRREAEKHLRESVREHGLCARVLGLEKGEGACFGFQIKKCRGACVGRETMQLHHARLLIALAGMKMRSWPFKGAVGIREQSSTGERTDIHVLNGWQHLGTADSEERLRDILEQPGQLAFDLDSYKILSRFLSRQGCRAEVLDLSHGLDANCLSGGGNHGMKAATVFPGAALELDTRCITTISA